MRAFLQQAHLCNRPIRDHATGTTPKIEHVADVAGLGQAVISYSSLSPASKKTSLRDEGSAKDASMSRPSHKPLED